MKAKGHDHDRKSDAEGSCNAKHNNHHTHTGGEEADAPLSNQLAHEYEHDFKFIRQSIMDARVAKHQEKKKGLKNNFQVLQESLRKLNDQAGLLEERAK